MSLQDQHLQQALKNAPDRDIAPNDVTRSAVLTYANKAVKRSQETWMARASDWMHQWFGASWHSVGLGSAVATVLIVVVFWHQQPYDTIWKVAKPTDETEISATDSVALSAPEAASAENSLDNRATETATQLHEPSVKMVENKAVIHTVPSKAKSVTPATSESSKPTANTDQLALKNSSLAGATSQTSSPVVIEPELPATVPASAPVVQDKSAVPNAKGELAKETRSESDTGLIIRREDIVAKKSAAKPDVPVAAQPEDVTNLQVNETLLTRIKNEGGKVAANQDIQVGNLRLIKVETQSKDLDTLNCSQSISQSAAVDGLTGYKIEFVGSCDVPASVLREFEIYNQTMRDWHSDHLR